MIIAPFPERFRLTAVVNANRAHPRGSYQLRRIADFRLHLCCEISPHFTDLLARAHRADT
jgi:hypothetical protein